MAGQLLLVNPRRRRRNPKSSGRKRRRNPRRMSALQRKYFGKRGHGRTVNPRRRRRNPVRRRRARLSNPVRRYRRRSNPVRHHRHRRRNPTMRLGGVTSTVMHAATGAVGAIAVDVAWGFMPIPAQFKTGATGTLAKAAVTLGLGMLASKALGRGMAEKATIGALTVQLYSFAKPMLAAAAPTIPGLGYYGAGYALNEYISSIPSSLNAFVPNSLMATEDDDTRNFPGDDLNMYIPMR